MITGYLIGGSGIKFAFVLAGIFLLIAGLVLAPLQLYRARRTHNGEFGLSASDLNRANATVDPDTVLSDQWRICFTWKDDGPYDVEIVDYH